SSTFVFSPETTRPSVPLRGESTLFDLPHPEPRPFDEARQVAHHVAVLLLLRLGERLPRHDQRVVLPAVVAPRRVRPALAHPLVHPTLVLADRQRLDLFVRQLD